MVSITQVPVLAQNSNSAPIEVDGVTTFGLSGSTQTVYVFDAVLELEHEQRLEKTRHPVQSGADISSHAYLQPARCVMYVGMSDAMDSFSSGYAGAGQSAALGGITATPSAVAPFSGASSSKSVNAYETMLTLQVARQPLTVTTRLRTYANMLLVAVSPKEDAKTITGLRMRLEFEQIILATTSVGPVVNSEQGAPTGGSVRPDADTVTGLGQVSPSALSKTTQNQFQYPPGAAVHGPLRGYLAGGTPDYYPVTIPSTVDVPGAGLFSSVAGQPAVEGVGVGQ